MLDGRFLISNSKKILELSKIFSTPKKITQSAWLFFNENFPRWAGGGFVHFMIVAPTELSFCLQ